MTGKIKVLLPLLLIFLLVGCGKTDDGLTIEGHDWTYANAIDSAGQPLDLSVLTCAAQDGTLTLTDSDGSTQSGTYTIYFETGGGVGIPVIASTTSTGRLNSLPTPTMSGYTFEGWYTDQLEGDKITVNTEFGADTTIYAHWVPNASDKTPAVTKPDTASTDGFAWKAHVGTMLVAGTILLTMAVLYLLQE